MKFPKLYALSSNGKIKTWEIEVERGTNGYGIIHVRHGYIDGKIQHNQHHRRDGRQSNPVAQALAGRPSGATILLSHTPWLADEAANSKVELMLSGHTHGGQIWPFSYLVRRIYPLLAGQYDVNGMAVIVCRGTGTWGPRMRLWLPGEIIRVVLRRDG